MEWAKVKVILILVFLVTDIFLGYKTFQMMAGTTLSREVIENTTQVLQMSSINVKCDIPKKANKQNWMLFMYESTDKKAIAKTFLGAENFNWVSGDTGERLQVGEKAIIIGKDGVIYFSDNKPEILKGVDGAGTAEKNVRAYLKKYYPQINRYVLDRSTYESNGNASFSFVEKTGGTNIIFDNYINVRIDGTGEINIESFYMRTIGPTRETNDIIPVNEILLTGFMRDVKALGKEINITDIKLGYLAVVDRESMILEGGTSGNIQSAPSWRIRTEDGREYFYNAYNGQRHIKK